MKKILYLLSLVLSFGAYAQSGIHTKTPQVTLQVNAKNTDGTTPEGIIAPRMTGEALHQADLNNVYGAAQDGTLTFVTEPPIPSERIGQTQDIDSPGYYYYVYSKNKWVRNTDDNVAPNVSTLACENIKFYTNQFIQGVPYSGALEVPYTNGNGASYPTSVFSSNGLTFLLSEGTLATGNGTLVYDVSGTPTTSGDVNLSFANQSCTIALDVTVPVKIDELNCNDYQLQPANIKFDTYYTGTFTVTYTGGNGSAYEGNTFTTGGLTFTLAPGILENGSGNLTYQVSGTPTTSGTIMIPINFADKICVATITIAHPVLESISCEDFTTLGGQHMLMPYPTLNEPVESNTILKVRYTGGDGTYHPAGEPITIGGLTFIRRALTLSLGTGGEIIYDVTGTPTQLSIEVPIQFYGHECTFYVGLQDDEHLAIKGRIWKRHNLGADTSLDADVLRKEIYGDYYKWGNQNAGANQNGFLGSWTYENQSDDYWLLTKNPCPSNYIVPTVDDISQLTSCSMKSGSIDGLWIDSTNKYSRGKEFKLTNGSQYKLTFPALGYIDRYTNGIISESGIRGQYWLSTKNGNNGYSLYFSNINTYIYDLDPSYGLAIRCISQ